jgi:hypothetical protein
LTDSLDGRRAWRDQQLAVSIPADVEPQEITPVLDVGDACLGLVEGQSPGMQPVGQPRLDLLGLLPGMAADDQVVGLCRGPGYAELPGGCLGFSGLVGF